MNESQFAPIRYLFHYFFGPPEVIAEFVRFIFDRTGRPAVSRLNAVELNGSGVPDFVLTHEWTMDEASGNRLDSIGGYTLAEQGVPVLNEPGQLGNASVHVAADNTWLEGASVDILPSSGPFTLSAWLKPGATNGLVQYGLVSAVSGAAADWRFAIYYTNARNASNCVLSDGASFFSLTISPMTITTGQYYLVALRRTAAGVWSFSVWDGLVWRDGSPQTFVLNPAVAPFAVGATPYGVLPANLSVDSIRIWSGIVINADVLALQSGLPAGPSSALALFNFSLQGQPGVSRLTNVAIFTTGQEA